MKSFGFLLIFTLLVAYNSQGQKKVTFNVTPSDAVIELKQGNTYIKLGQGSYELKLSGDDLYTVRIWKEGYLPFEKTYLRAKGDPLIENVTLDTRVVKLTVLPTTAEVYRELTFLGKGGKELDIPVKAGESTQITVQCEGFKSIKKTYYNIESVEVPPIKDNIQLVDRVIKVTADPQGASILADGIKMGETNADVIVPNNSCVTISVTKEGFAPTEESFCNKRDEENPPYAKSFSLKDRLVQVVTAPDDASIKIDGRTVGNGTYTVSLKVGQCATVEVSREGFDAQIKTFCNQPSAEAPPATASIKLIEDEAYAASFKDEQTNINYAISVNTKYTNDKAWKTISQVIMQKFDVIEVTDPVTGYMRTAWNVKTFQNGKTIRTRCIVKLGSTDPLKYVVKMVSEISSIPGASVKDDENFKEWDRLLSTYKDVISEIQARIN